MRIGSINQVSQLYQTQATARKKSVSKEVQVETYSVSSFGKDYQTAKKALETTPDVREDKVASLKEQVNSGQYQVSDEDFATHLMTAFRNRTI